MVMTSSQFADLVEGPTKEIFDGQYQRHDAEWSVIFASKPGRKARFQDLTVLYGLGPAPEKYEGSQILVDQGGIAYRVRGVFKNYATMVGITEEMRDDAEGLSTAAWLGKETAKALNETKEIVHADIFNRSESATYIHGDGKTLLATDHPYGIGGSYSNKLAAAADLSEASLETLGIMVHNAKDDRGLPMRLRVVRLIVSPTNWYNATRILRSTLQSGSANNDVNAIRTTNDIPADPFVLHRLTQVNAYFLQTNAEHGLKHFTRGGVRRAMEADFTTGNCFWKASERYLALVEGSRSVYGSLGM